MNYYEDLKYHFRPKKGWINDPNGLVYFNGYYHVFYQHAPNFEVPWQEPMHWGHARTKDFIRWEELPIALFPDMPYDRDGCWSGTAIVKDDVLYLVYTGRVKPDPNIPSTQRPCIAYSYDGVSFHKYENNPVIRDCPEDIDKNNFRDPSIALIDGKYYLAVATGNRERDTGDIALFESSDLFDYKYLGVMKSWSDAKYAECPSLIGTDDSVWLAASVCRHKEHFFSVMQGDFKDGKYTERLASCVDMGPDQYAGQMFKDHLGRIILITWVSGWNYNGFVKGHDVGCMSCPREFLVKDGKICAYPVKEVRHLLTDSDPAVKITRDGFEIQRQGRESVVYRGEIRDLKILRDNYVVEVFVNGGEEIYTAIL